jgi:hypothetical protein
MTDLTPDARSILEAGREQDGAGDLEKARVRRALFAKIAAGGAVLAAASTAAADGGAVAGGGATATGAAGTATGTYAAVASPLAKILIPLAIIVGGGAGGAVAWRAQRAIAPTSVTMSAPSTQAAPTPTPVQAPAIAPVIEPMMPPPAARPTPAPAHHVHVAAPVHVDATTNRLAEETALLAASNGELRRGDARRALSLLDDYDRRYPSGVLREEVLATRFIARCQLGALDSASRRGADAFLARHPASPLAPRVRSSCDR